MAYISHSSFDYRSLRERAGHASPVLLARCAFLALAAAVAVLALSGSHAPTTSAGLAAKGDRLAGIVSASSTAGDSVVRSDLAAGVSFAEKASIAPSGAGAR